MGRLGEVEDTLEALERLSRKRGQLRTAVDGSMIRARDDFHVEGDDHHSSSLLAPFAEDDAAKEGDAGTVSVSSSTLVLSPEEGDFAFKQVKCNRRRRVC